MPAHRDLVVAARAGDRDAFEALYRTYFPATYDFAVRTVGDPNRAADVVQDAWIKAYERIDQLRDPDAFRAWLFAIVRREALAGFRRAKRTRPVATLVDDEAPNELVRLVDEDPEGDPVTAAELTDSARIVWEAASALDPRTYAVLDLHVRQGLSSAEIAEVLGVSAGNAAVMLHRMKERVGKAIEANLLARAGTEDCPELAALVEGATFPPLERRLVRRVDRHARGCATCGKTRRRLVAPMTIFAALAAVAPPEGLADRIWASMPSTPPGRGGSRGGHRGLVAAATVAAFVLFGASLVAGVQVAGRSRTAPAAPAMTTSSSATPVSAPTPTTSSPASSTTTTSTTTTTTTTSTTTTTTTTTTTLPPGEAPRLADPWSERGDLVELDEQGAPCVFRFSNQVLDLSRTTLSVRAVDPDGDLAWVGAHWVLGDLAGTIDLVADGETWSGPFGPFPPGTVPTKGAATATISFEAVDAEGMRTTLDDVLEVVVYSYATC